MWICSSKISGFGSFLSLWVFSICLFTSLLAQQVKQLESKQNHGISCRHVYSCVRM